MTLPPYHPQVRALAKRVCDALEADQPEGYDLEAGMFGPHFSTLIAELAAATAAQPSIIKALRRAFVLIGSVADDPDHPEHDSAVAWLEQAKTLFLEVGDTVEIKHAPESATGATAAQP